MFCLLVVLFELSVRTCGLARKTPPRKPNHGEGIVSRKPRPKSARDVLGLLLYCFIVLLCTCVVSCPYVTYCPTVRAQYSLFVLKVPLNPKQTNKQARCWKGFDHYLIVWITWTIWMRLHSFSALTWLVGQQEEHLASEKLGVCCWWHLTGALHVL